MKDVDKIGYTPVTSNEEVMFQMLIRLDALCNMVSSLCEHVAKRDNVAVETCVEKIDVPKKTRK